MSIEAVLGGLAFAGLFTLWVVLPSRVRRNAEDVDAEGESERDENLSLHSSLTIAASLGLSLRGSLEAR